MEKYGIVFKNRDSATVYYDGTIRDFMELILKNEIVNMSLCGTETWNCGKDKQTKMKQILFRCADVTAIYHDEAENEED